MTNPAPFNHAPAGQPAVLDSVVAAYLSGAFRQVALGRPAAAPRLLREAASYTEFGLHYEIPVPSA